jgi:opacity protein-like surface antigen
MRKIAIVILSIITLGSISFAGGKLVEPALDPVAPVMDSGFYLGIGASAMSLRNDLSDEEFSSPGVMLQAGYQFNKYIAVEGRYTKNVGKLKYDHGTTSNLDNDDYPADFTNGGIYLKPMLPMENFILYGLIGYGQVKMTNLPGGAGTADRSESGLQWGAGVSYRASKNLSISVDYVRFYDDTGFDYRGTTANVVADAWTLSVSYKF